MLRKLVTAALLGGAVLLVGHARAALVYNWKFDGGTPGAPTTGAGGVFTASSPGAFTGTGVSGLLGDTAYVNATGTTGGAISPFTPGDVSSLANPTSKLTITFWVQSTGAWTAQPQQFARLFMLGENNTYDSAGTSTVNAQSGFSIAVNGGNKLQVGIGKSITRVSVNPLFTDAGGNWIFVALQYDGAIGAFPGTGNGPQATDRNFVVLKGDTTTAATLAYSDAMTVADFTTTPGPVQFSATSVARVANNNNNNRGFKGLIDDVRIYDNLLTASQLQAVQQEAGVPAPEPATIGLLATGAVMLLRRRRCAA